MPDAATVRRAHPYGRVFARARGAFDGPFRFEAHAGVDGLAEELDSRRLEPLARLGDVGDTEGEAAVLGANGTSSASGCQSSSVTGDGHMLGRMRG